MGQSPALSGSGSASHVHAGAQLPRAVPCLCPAGAGTRFIIHLPRGGRLRSHAGGSVGARRLGASSPGKICVRHSAVVPWLQPHGLGCQSQGQRCARQGPSSTGSAHRRHSRRLPPPRQQAACRPPPWFTGAALRLVACGQDRNPSRIATPATFRQPGAACSSAAQLPGPHPR